MLRTIVHLCIIGMLIFACAAVSSAGELDSAFGVDGRVALEIGAYGDRAQAVALQDDGKILLGGSSTNGEYLAASLFRLLADGSPDSGFNGDGTVIVDVGDGDDEILTLALSPEGDIVAGGYTGNGKDRDFLLIRFHADGSLDTDFGDQGVVVTAVGNSDDEITALVVAKNGKILVAGNAAGTNGRVLVLGRYLKDGRLDPGFGDQGLSLTGVGTDALAQGLAVDDDGRVVVSGSYTDGRHTQLMLAGFTSDGRLNPGFGADGIATTVNRDEISEGYGMYRAENGDLYVAGSLGPEGARAAALFRFTSQGHADSSFGEDGILVTEVGPEDDVLYSLDGNSTSLNGAGFTTINGNREFLLITYDRKDDSPGEPVRLSGNKTANLHIGDLLVKESLASYKPEPATDSDQLLPAVVTTSFGSGESVSYALAMQKDGKVVTVGTIGGDGKTSAGVARFGTGKSLTAAGGAVDNNVNINTLPITDIKATGAFSGGNINAALGSVTQRGVVFSIAPYPVCKDDCAKGIAPGNPTNPSKPSNPDNSENKGPPDISDPQPSGQVASDSVTLSVTTDVNATCKYGETAGVDFDSMVKTFSSTGGTKHSQRITGLENGAEKKYYVRCKNNATGAVNSTDTEISFVIKLPNKTTSLQVMTKTNLFLASASESIGNFLVPSVHAQAVNTGATDPATANTNSTSSSSLKMLKEGYTLDGSGTGLYSSIMEDLAPDTRYYVRAYAIVGGVTYYGPQIIFETSSACFIATAAYGSLLDPAVVVLRRFRDHYLNTNSLGRRFVTWYYTNSPPIADRIAASPMLRFITRILLVPVIGAGWLLLHPAPAGMLLFLLSMVVILIRRRSRAPSIAA